MATFNQTSKTYIQSDAEFRTMLGYYRTALTNFGWVQTADTGQINPATATYPGSNNSDSGFEIWGMDDALQATRPVYMKIRYGRGSANGVFRLAISFSMSATTGVGTFSGVESGTGNFEAAQAPSTRPIGDATLYNIDGSGANNRFCFANFSDTLAAGFGSVFGVERVLDANGDPTDKGIFAWGGALRQNVNNWFGLNFPWNPGYIPLWRNNNSGPGYVQFSTGDFGATVRQSGDPTSTLYEGKVFLFPIYPAFPGWKYPGRNFLQYALNDLPTDRTNVTIPYYGADRTYRPLGLGPVSSFGAGPTQAGTLAIRFE